MEKALSFGGRPYFSSLPVGGLRATTGTKSCVVSDIYYLEQRRDESTSILIGDGSCCILHCSGLGLGAQSLILRSR